MEAAVLTDHEEAPRFGSFEEPSSDGQTVVDVDVAGLNPVDLTIASGRFPGRKPPLPSVVGLEGVGTVGGRRVYFDAPVAPFGSMGERAAVDPESLIDVPDELDAGLAVSFGVSGLAAWLALTWRAELQPDESVLVLGASGVVGQIAIQAARLLGAGRLVAAARDEASLGRAQSELGADAIVRLDGGADLGERLRDAGGGGFDVVVDPVWGDAAVAALSALNLDGRLVQVGSASGDTAEISARGFRNQLGRIVGHTNFKASHELKRDAFGAMCTHAVAGELTVDVQRVPLDEVNAAWGRESPHRKVVLEVDSSGGGGADGDRVSSGEREAQAAGAEAAGVGGKVEPLSDDPAREPLEEAGEGESEGFEQAERRLEDIAEHGDEHRFPDRDVPPAEEGSG